MFFRSTPLLVVDNPTPTLEVQTVALKINSLR